jgi:hypothetical protein
MFLGGKTHKLIKCPGLVPQLSFQRVENKVMATLPFFTGDSIEKSTFKAIQIFG